MNKKFALEETLIKAARRQREVSDRAKQTATEIAARKKPPGTPGGGTKA